MKIENTRIATSGLLRCCIQTLREIPPGTRVQSGDLKQCAYCGDWMWLKGDRWEWWVDHTKPPFDRSQEES
jgi:hypothetical protein